MALMTGTLASVEAVDLVTHLTVDAPVGATSLLVEHPSVIPAAGGSLAVGPTAVKATGVNADTGAVMLAAPLTVAYEAGMPVWVVGQVTYYGQVIPDDPDGQPVQCVIPPERTTQIPKDAVMALQVVLELDRGQWVLARVVGEEPQVNLGDAGQGGSSQPLTVGHPRTGLVRMGLDQLGRPNILMSVGTERGSTLPAFLYTGVTDDNPYLSDTGQTYTVLQPPQTLPFVPFEGNERAVVGLRMTSRPDETAADTSLPSEAYLAADRIVLDGDVEVKGRPVSRRGRTTSTVQAIPHATVTTIQFPQSSESAGFGYSAGVWTTQVAGLYLLTAHVDIEHNPDGYRTLAVRVGADAVARDVRDAVTLAATTLEVVKPYRLAVGDTVAFTVYQNSGASLSVLSSLYTSADLIRL